MLLISLALSKTYTLNWILFLIKFNLIIKLKLSLLLINDLIFLVITAIVCEEHSKRVSQFTYFFELQKWIEKISLNLEIGSGEWLQKLINYNLDNIINFNSTWVNIYPNDLKQLERLIEQVHCFSTLLIQVLCRPYFLLLNKLFISSLRLRLSSLSCWATLSNVRFYAMFIC